MIVSDRVVCSADLVLAVEDGYVFRHDDVWALAERIGMLVRDSGRGREFGRRSREIISQRSIERMADGIVRAFTRVVGDGGRIRKE